MRRVNAFVIFALVLVACGANRDTTTQPTAPLATRVNAEEGPQPTAAPAPTAAPVPTEAPKPTSTPIVLPTRNPSLKAEGVPPKDKDNCPDDYPIKGNIGDSGKIYHVKGGASYNRTDPEICFASSADAEKAGFTAANQ